MSLAAQGLTVPNRKAVLESGIKDELRRAGKTLRLTSQDFNALIKELTPRERKLVDFIKQQYNTRSRQLVNEGSLKLDGYERATVKDYLSMLRDLTETEKGLSGILSRWRRFLEGLGLLKPREGGKIPLLYGDIFKEYFEHMNAVAAYSKMGPALRDAEMMLGDPEVAKALTNRLGKQQLDFWIKRQDAITDLAKNGMPGYAENLAQMVLDPAIKFALRLNVFSAVRQISGWTLAGQEAGAKYFAIAEAKMKKPGQSAKTYTEMLEHSSDMWHRYNLGAPDMLSPKFTATTVSRENILDRQLSPIWLFDRRKSGLLWEAKK
jgi:hypothetical protein